jgi:hypothetical protein
MSTLAPVSGSFLSPRLRRPRAGTQYPVAYFAYRCWLSAKIFSCQFMSFLENCARPSRFVRTLAEWVLTC